MLEMHGLAGERAEARGDEHQPGEQLRPIRRRAQEPACLLGEIEQDRIGIEHPRRLAAGPFGVDDRRHLAVRIDGAEFRLVLLALGGVHRHDLIGKPEPSSRSATLAGLGVGWK